MAHQVSYRQGFGPGQPGDMSVSAIHTSEGGAEIQNGILYLTSVRPSLPLPQPRHTALDSHEHFQQICKVTETYKHRCPEGYKPAQPDNRSLSSTQISEGGAEVQDEHLYLPLASMPSVPRTHPTTLVSDEHFQLHEEVEIKLPSIVDSQIALKHSEQTCSTSNASSASQPSKVVKTKLPAVVDSVNAVSQISNASSASQPSKVVKPKLPAVVDSVNAVSQISNASSTSEQGKEANPELPKTSDVTQASTDQKPVKGRSSLACKDTSTPNASSASQPSGPSIVGSKKAMSKLFEASPSPTDLNFAEYVASNGPLVRRYKLFTSDPATISKRKGTRLFRKAVCYVVRAHRAKKSWGGDFEDIHLMIASDGSFYLALEPNAECTGFNFLEDLCKIVRLLIEHFKDKRSGLTAIYFLHLLHICNTPPPSIFSSDLKFDIFVDYVVHRPCFGHPMSRSDFITGAGQWLKYCSDPDVAIIIDCVDAAANDSGSGDNYDWKALLDFSLLDILWDGIPPEQREGHHPRLGELPRHQFIFCRHAFVHLMERTLYPVEDPTSQNQVIVLQGMPTPVETDYIIGVRFDRFIADSIFRILLDDTLHTNRFIKERWNAFKRSFGSSKELEDEEDEEDKLPIAGCNMVEEKL